MPVYKVKCPGHDCGEEFALETTAPIDGGKQIQTCPHCGRLLSTKIEHNKVVGKSIIIR